MEKVKLTAIEDVTSGVNDKTGKSWQLIKISVEGKDPQFKGFANKQTAEWTVGSVVDLSFENDSKYGWQFSVPKEIDNVNARLDNLEESVSALLRAVKPDMGVKQAPVGDGVKEYDSPPPTDEDDLPF